ncbi:MAG: right-handed parallel beta-helix repeat-containing protein, partial [Ignavibacteriaceae bacterium]|nr:right-handed parallel beta-helix repeat-containing protein [Ignavibacteriaceae bacterium]
YTTWETAADSIQECINICVFGDTIYVANGVYEEQVVMIPGLALIGSGSDSCWIDSRQLVTMQNYKTIDMKNNCLVKGFYIRSTNNFDYGYGIYTEAETGLISENKFSNANTGIILRYTDVQVYENYIFNVRRGISLVNSNSIVRKNLMIMNVEGVQGIRVEAFTNNYTPIIDSNEILNVYDKGIYKFFGTRPTIKNNYIQVKYDTGIELQESDSAKVLNNVIVNPGYYGINNPTYLNLIAENNYIIGKPSLNGIIVGPNSVIKNNVVTNANIGIGKYGTVNPVVQFNNSWNNTTNYENGINPDTTNLSVNPMIVNDDSTQGKLDFHLQKYSFLIDAGDPDILDKDGTRSDIGLYGGPYGESYVYVDLPPRTPVNLTAGVDSNIVTLKWNKNTEADFSYYKIFFDITKNFQIDSTKLISSQPDTFYYFVIPAGAESLYFKLTSVDNQGNESSPTEEVGVIVTSVKDEWKLVNNYILYQNYPNPFNPSTRIGYKLKERGYVKLYVYDVKGELVSVLVNEVQESGYYEVEFSTGVGSGQWAVGKSLASGVYIYQIFVSNENRIPVFSDIKKMVYLK